MNTQPSPSPAFIGIDIGGTKTLGVAVNENGDLLEERLLPTPQGAAELIGTTSSMYFELSERVAQSSPERFEVLGLGIGIAGLVDIDGKLRRAPNLVEVDGLDIGPILKSKLGVPVYVDNDVNCAALAELSDGVAASANNSLLVTLGTGIGGALIVDGRIHRGAFGMAGEPGHMIVNPRGLICACGKQGCWEAYASAAGLKNLAIDKAKNGRLQQINDKVQGDLNKIASEDITQAARRGDIQSVELIDDFAYWIALGLTNCAALLDPELIIIGGGLVAEWDLLGDRIRHSFDELLLASTQRNRIPIKPAENGKAAGAIGATLLGRQR
ncbi:MAG: glucokinase [Actinobacteria bacterium]|nr:glucokinase [Actinomycetota bacterium]